MCVCVCMCARAHLQVALVLRRYVHEEEDVNPKGIYQNDIPIRTNGRGTGYGR